MSSPVLTLFDPGAETEVHADASKYAYGAVLLQKNEDDQMFHPVEYFSRKTKPAEEVYHSYELEVLAIIEALKKWRVYLLGIQFRIITDCNPFTITMKKRDVPLRVSRWALFLQDYHYSIEHRSGRKMQHVDALSRVSWLHIEDSLHCRIEQEQLKDDWTEAVRKAVEVDQYKDFYMKRGILYKDPVKELIVVPASMESEIIRLAHQQGHFAAKRTQEAVEKTFFIPHIQSKVEKIVRACVKCIVVEGKAGKKEGFLSTIPKEGYPLGTYHVDHVGPLVLTKKAYQYLFVVVDAFSKFVWLHPTKSTGAGEVVVKLQVQAATFGNPKRIISDRGAAFVSNQFREYCEQESIQHLLIATGVPRGNGQVERMHRIIVPMLSKMCHEDSRVWYKHVNRIQQVINSTPTRSTKFSPMKLLIGVEMRINILPELKEMLDKEELMAMDEERDSARDEARENIVKLQAENRREYNKRRREEVKYVEGDLVAIKRTQYGVGLKLQPKFLGPYRVVKALPHGRYNVVKVGDHEGPGTKTTVAEFMKSWGEASSFGSNGTSGGPSCSERSAQPPVRRSERQHRQVKECTATPKKRVREKQMM